MSADHKRPLLAFVLVLVVCVLIVVDGLRGQAAVVTALRAGAGQVVKGVELVAIHADEPPSRQLMEPPVLEAAGTSHDHAPAAAQPAPSAAPAPAPQGHGQQPGGPAHPAHPAHPHAGPAAAGEQAEGHPGHPHEVRVPGQHVVQSLTHRLGQLLGRHEGPAPGRGPESRADRGRGHGQRGREDHGRGHDNRGLDNRSRGDRGHGHAWGPHHGWTRSR